MNISKGFIEYDEYMRFQTWVIGITLWVILAWFAVEPILKGGLK